MSRLTSFAKSVINGWLDANAFTLAAALAYYAIFAIAPLLLISIHLASLFLDRTAAVEGLTSEFIGIIGPTGSHAVKEMLDAAGTAEPKGWAGLISIGVVLFAAIGFVGSLQDALDKIWDAPPVPLVCGRSSKANCFPSASSWVRHLCFSSRSSCPPRCQHSRQASRLHSDCQTRSLSLSSPTFLYPASSSLRYSSSCRPCSFLGARLP